jgi:hypothetical protein
MRRQAGGVRAIITETGKPDGPLFAREGANVRNAFPVNPGVNGRIRRALSGDKLKRDRGALPAVLTLTAKPDRLYPQCFFHRSNPLVALKPHRSAQSRICTQKPRKHAKKRHPTQ